MSCCDSAVDGALRESKPLTLAVCAVLIDADGRVLIAERPPGKPYAGFWEFPGGKLDAGESPQAALIRELEEELGVRTCAGCFQAYRFIAWSYPEHHVLIPVFLCRQWEGIPEGREGQRLRWLFPDEAGGLPMPEGNAETLRELAEELRFMRRGG